MPDAGRRIFSVNRDAAPPPLLPERSDALELEATFAWPTATVPAAFNPHSALGLAAPEQLGDSSSSAVSVSRPSSPAPSSSRSRALRAFLDPTLTAATTSSLSSASRPRTPSLFSNSSGCPSLISNGNRSASSSSFPSTPLASDFGMLVSVDDPPTPRARKEGNSANGSLPFHARPHSKWDPSLVVEDAPSIVTTGLPITRLTFFGAQQASSPVGRTSAGLSPTARQGQSLSTRTGQSASAVGTGLFADSTRKARDTSYLSRLAPTPTSSPFALGRSKPDPHPAQPQIPYAVRDSDAVREMEVLLLESIRWGLLGGKTSFIELEDGQSPPARVLDIGCGTGAWCIATAVQWPTSHFVGFDVSTGQTNLTERARYQQQRADARHRAGRPARATAVNWADLDRRIEWVHGNFLEMLPFDTGVFDHVRIAFGNLGIPESSWQDVLEECTRVLERGTGILEIVELSGELPGGLTPTPPPSPALQQPPVAVPARTRPLAVPATQQHARSDSTSVPPGPTSRKAHFDRHLHRHMVQPLSDVTIRSSLLMQSGMSKSREVFSQTYRRSPAGHLPSKDGSLGVSQDAHLNAAPGFIGAATGVWIEAMAPASLRSSTSVFPSLHQSIVQLLLADLAARGVEWAESGRFPDETAKRSRRRSLMPARSSTQALDPVPDLGTLSLHAWVGVKSTAAGARG